MPLGKRRGSLEQPPWKQLKITEALAALDNQRSAQKNQLLAACDTGISENAAPMSLADTSSGSILEQCGTLMAPDRVDDLERPPIKSSRCEARNVGVRRRLSTKRPSPLAYEIMWTSACNGKRSWPRQARTAFDADVAAMERGDVPRIPFCSLSRKKAVYRVGVKIDGRWQGKTYSRREDAEKASKVLQAQYPQRARIHAPRGFARKKISTRTRKPWPPLASRKAELEKYMQEHECLPKGIYWNGKYFVAMINRITLKRFCVCGSLTEAELAVKKLDALATNGCHGQRSRREGNQPERYTVHLSRRRPSQIRKFDQERFALLAWASIFPQGSFHVTCDFARSDALFRDETNVDSWLRCQWKTSARTTELASTKGLVFRLQDKLRYQGMALVLEWTCCPKYVWVLWGCVSLPENIYLTLSQWNACGAKHGKRIPRAELFAVLTTMRSQAICEGSAVSIFTAEHEFNARSHQIERASIDVYMAARRGRQILPVGCAPTTNNESAPTCSSPAQSIMEWRFPRLTALRHDVEIYDGIRFQRHQMKTVQRRNECYYGTLHTYVGKEAGGKALNVNKYSVNDADVYTFVYWTDMSEDLLKVEFWNIPEETMLERGYIHHSHHDATRHKLPLVLKLLRPGDHLSGRRRRFHFVKNSKWTQAFYESHVLPRALFARQ